jgi:hypothetical protein
VRYLPPLLFGSRLQVLAVTCGGEGMRDLAYACGFVVTIFLTAMLAMIWYDKARPHARVKSKKARKSD